MKNLHKAKLCTAVIVINLIGVYIAFLAACAKSGTIQKLRLIGESAAANELVFNMIFALAAFAACAVFAELKRQKYQSLHDEHEAKKYKNHNYGFFG